MSKLDEVRARKATVVFNSRADARYLATILAFWYDKGEKPRSVSELVRITLETFADLMITNNMVEMVASQEIAFDMFERAGILNKKMRELNKKNLVDAMVKEGVDFSALEGVDTLGTHRVTPAPVGATPDFNIALTALENNLDKGIEERVNDAKNRTQGFKDSLGIKPGGGSDE